MTEIRSYRRVFDLERRIYGIDRLRLNPGGVPVRGVVYLLVGLGLCVSATALPVLGPCVGDLPWYLRDLALPGVAATALGAIRIEGRTFHLAAGALLRHWMEPRRLACLSRCWGTGELWCPSEIVLLPDGSDARMRRVRYTGAGAVRVSLEHERLGRASERGASGLARPGWRAELILRQAPAAAVLASAQVISLEPGARVLVRASANGSA